MTNALRTSSVELRNVIKNYGTSAANAVDDVTLHIEGGEFMTFLGPSGSGKTTMLNAIAGFMPITSGKILIAGIDVSKLPSHKRNLGMVFQHYALFPHISVLGNVTFPLRRRGVAKKDARIRAMKVLSTMGLNGLENRLPKQLSGGQQQRVAVARAVVYSPNVVLMDEPLGALDKRLREQVQSEIKRLHRDLGLTFIYVTHDQEEALALSDRIAVFDNGRVEQVGTGQELYERPATRFVANFLGESMILPGRCDGNVFILAGNTVIPLPSDIGARNPDSVMVRPENIRLSADESGALDGPRLLGTIVETMYLGSITKTVVDLIDGATATVRERADAGGDLRVGDRAVVSWRPRHSVFLGDV